MEHRSPMTKQPYMSYICQFKRFRRNWLSYLCLEYITINLIFGPHPNSIHPFGRGVMLEHNIDLGYTSTHLSKKRLHWNQKTGIRSYWTEPLSLRFYLRKSSTGQRSTTSNTLKRVADLVSSNLLIKAATIRSDAMVKFCIVPRCDLKLICLFFGFLYWLMWLWVLVYRLA